MHCYYLVCLICISKFQESLEHAKKLGVFSVTTENVYGKVTYVILLTTVEIIVMNQQKMVLFVVGVFDFFLV